MSSESENEDYYMNGPCCHCGSDIGKMTYLDNGEWVCDDPDCYEQSDIKSRLNNASQ